MMPGGELIERRVELLTIVEAEENKKELAEFLEDNETDLTHHVGENPLKIIQRMDKDQVEEAIDHIEECI